MWTSNIFSMIFTRLKCDVSNALKTKYPDLFFTNSDKVKSEAKFPTVLVKEIGSTENGSDLENTAVNSIVCTVQIDTIDNRSQKRADEVMDRVVSVMKGLKFTIIAMPQFENTNETYRMTARFRRTIDWNDVL